MNLQQLRTLAMIAEQGTFAAAARIVNLSQSAISVQMKQLEEELGVKLFRRETRPMALTSKGKRISQSADEIINQLEKINAIASDNAIGGSIRIGFVPTALQNILPFVLNELRNRHPKLKVIVSSGLSGELAAFVSQRELDIAILTAPTVTMPGISVTEIADEPLFAIGLDEGATFADDKDLIQSRLFISFNTKTWLGQQIATRLQSRSLRIHKVMEVDSLDAIERLVLGGFGVSIVPQRFLAPKLCKQLIQIPFCVPNEVRKLVMIHSTMGPSIEVVNTLEKKFWLETADGVVSIENRI